MKVNNKSETGVSTEVENSAEIENTMEVENVVQVENSGEEGNSTEVVTSTEQQNSLETENSTEASGSAEINISIDEEDPTEMENSADTFIPAKVFIKSDTCTEIQCNTTDNVVVTLPNHGVEIEQELNAVARTPAIEKSLVKNLTGQSSGINIGSNITGAMQQHANGACESDTNIMDYNYDIETDLDLEDCSSVSYSVNFNMVNNASLVKSNLEMPKMVQLTVNTASTSNGNTSSYNVPANPIAELDQKLKSVWTLWVFQYERNKTWFDMYQEFVSFSTINEFWTLYDHLKPPSELYTGTDLFFFKKGIKPVWEDKTNQCGGSWRCSLLKSQYVAADKLWLQALLLLIQDKIKFSDYICGARISVRSNVFRLSIWTKKAYYKVPTVAIGVHLRNILRIRMRYLLHKDAMNYHRVPKWTYIA